MEIQLRVRYCPRHYDSEIRMTLGEGSASSACSTRSRSSLISTGGCIPSPRVGYTKRGELELSMFFPVVTAFLLGFQHESVSDRTDRFQFIASPIRL